MKQAISQLSSSHEPFIKGSHKQGKSVYVVRMRVILNRLLYGAVFWLISYVFLTPLVPRQSHLFISCVPL